MGNNVKLTKKDVRGSWARWMLYCHSAYNYEMYQGMGFTHAMSHAMKKLYPNDPEKLGEELKKHTVFFNSATHTGGLIHGAVLAMEEERANGAEEVTPELINSIKTGLMGPLAGIGDSLVQGIITPIFLAIGMSLTEAMGVTGPIIYLIAIISVITGIAYTSWMQGYRLGTEAISRFIEGGMMTKLLGAAGTLGTFVLGGLVSKYVNITTSLRLQLDTVDFILQTNFFDKLMPNMLSLVATMIVFYYVKKGKKTTHIMFVLFALGIVLGLLGIVGAVPTPAAS